MDGSRGGLERRRLRKGWRRGAGLGLASALALAGCDCEAAKRQMDQTADDGFAQAWRCCEELREIDEAAGFACFEELRDWRQDITLLILQWYQACLDGNQEIAGTVLRSLRTLFRQGFVGCGSLEPGLAGGYRTAGLPTTPSDRIDLEGHWAPVPAGAAGPLTVQRFEVVGTFQFDSVRARANGSMHGQLTIDRARSNAPSVEQFQLSLATAAGDVTLRLHDPEGESKWEEVDRGGTVRARVRIEATGRLALLLPPEAWIELPLDGDGRGLRAPPRLELERILPRALGFADWDGDRDADLADRDAFYSAPESTRDLDLSGSYDDRDEAIFKAAWHRAVGPRVRR